MLMEFDMRGVFLAVCAGVLFQVAPAWAEDGCARIESATATIAASVPASIQSQNGASTPAVVVASTDSTTRPAAAER
jgi:hypothetical protein